MKICMVAYTRYASDGRLHRYARALIGRGDRVDVIGYGHGNDPDHDVHDGVHIFNLHRRHFDESSPLTFLVRLIRFFIKTAFVLAWKHLKNRYDVIHYHNIPDFGIFCTWFPKCFGARIILDIHDLVPEFYMRKFEKQASSPIIRLLTLTERMACAYADHVITVTEIWRKTLAGRSVSPEKCSVIMNLPIEEVFRRVPFNAHRSGQPFILTYHGNLAEQTGVDNLIRAFDLIRRHIPDVRLQIIGSGHDEKRLRMLVKSLGIESGIDFRPVVSVSEIPRHVRHAHLAIDPKRDGMYAGETLSVKSMEYLALGIPLVVSRTKATAYYFSEEAVRFVRADDIEALSEAVLLLIRQPDLRKRLYENSAQFSKRFNWRSEKGKYFSILDKLNA